MGFGTMDGPENPLLPLSQIARALGTSTDAFFDPPPSDLAKTAELLRVWLTIEDEMARDTILAFIQNIAPKMLIKSAAE